MSFYSKIVDELNAAVQTKDAAKVVLAARDAGRLGKDLAVKEFQVILLELLFSTEEDMLGLGKAFGLGQLGSCQFKSANDVGDLEEAVFRRFYSWDEFSSRGVDSKGFLEKRGEFALSVVVIDLQLVVGIEIICMRNKERGHLLKKPVVERLYIVNKSLIDGETAIGDFRAAHKGQ